MVAKLGGIFEHNFGISKRALPLILNSHKESQRYMKDINKVILLGRLGSDPEQKFTRNGQCVVYFSVATSFKIKKEVTSERNIFENSSSPPDNEIESFNQKKSNLSANGDCKDFPNSPDIENEINLNPDTDQDLQSESVSKPEWDQPEKSPEISKNQKQYVEKTQWHRIIAWGKLGEVCLKFLRKGHSVYLEGSCRSHAYLNKNGQPRMSFEIYLEDISFLGKPKFETLEPLVQKVLE